MFWKRLLSFFVPSPGALTTAWAALIISLLLSATITIFWLAEPGNVNPSILYSLLAFPTGALLLSIATALERKPGARFLLWAGVCGLALLSTAGMLLAGYLDASAPFAGTLSLVTCCCLPFAGSLGLVLIFFGWKAYPIFQRTLRAARLQRMLTMIEVRGEVSCQDLSTELSLGEEAVEKLVRGLIADGELMAYFDIQHRRVYSAAALNEKQRRLLSMINIQGKASLETLADELKIPRELLKQWIYSLAQRKQLHGFADWSDGTVYSQDIEALIAQNLCPHCGGKLDVAGKGLLQCEYCGVEMFL
jgi:biotin operon repressor